MKDTLISYLAAVLVNLALVWSSDVSNRPARRAVPALVRVFQGVEVSARPNLEGSFRVHIGLVLDQRLRLSAADPLEPLFPRTLRWEGLESSVAVLN